MIDSTDYVVLLLQITSVRADTMDMMVTSLPATSSVTNLQMACVPPSPMAAQL